MCAISTHIYHTIQDVTDNSMSTDFFFFKATSSADELGSWRGSEQIREKKVSIHGKSSQVGSWPGE